MKIIINFLLLGFIHQASLKAFKASNLCGYDACPVGKNDMLNVHIISHTHDDVGWLKTADEYFYGDKNYIQNAGVQYILDSVIDELEKDSARRFIYVETSFFWRWWNSRDDLIHKRVQKLVLSGQLEFISGGWSMNDEASNYYVDTIDQMTWGFRFLNDTFGPCSVPRVGWQIDPFGHSREQASLLAQMGFDGLFIGRLDYQDKDNREATRTMEFVWNGSANLGVDSQLFTGVLPNYYSPPNGFCFDLLCNDEPIKDNPLLKDYNVNDKVSKFLDIIQNQAKKYATNHIIVTMGNDFNYQAAHTWFFNLDKLIKYVNLRQKDGVKVNLFYSTPSCYLKALNDSNKYWTVKTDDFFPYASDPNSYWTGYFTSRPAFKRYTKITNNLLQAGKQISVYANMDNELSLAVLKRFQGDAQHHDAITGTAKQVVTYDYAESLAIGQAYVEDSMNKAYAQLMALDPSFPPPRQVFCHYLNVSFCEATENQDSFTVTVYNPLGHNFKAYIRLPVTSTLYSVNGPDGRPVMSQIVGIPAQVMKSPEKNGTAANELVFAVDLVPSGFSSYFVQKYSRTEKHRHKSKVFHPTPQPEDLVIQNEFLTVVVDGTTGLLKRITDIQSKTTLRVKQNFYYYVGHNGNNSSPIFRASGAYIFRPNGTDAIAIGEGVVAKLHKGPVVQEIQQTFSSYVSQVIRLYPGIYGVELEWLVGPIPVKDDIGKEVISRFDTDLETHELFYTDANGREILERRRNYRPTWSVNISEPVSGNYYPVNSRIFIQDTKRDVQFTVVTDRSQGGSSLTDGSIELMLHRRLLHDDAFGVNEALNETGVDGKGLQVRGKHHIFFNSIAQSPIIHRSAALKVSFPPIVSIASLPFSIREWQKSFLTMYSGLTAPLPANVHLLTVEPWKDKTILIRLEHLFEVSDSPELYSKPVTINLQYLFTSFKIFEATETTLGGNIWLKDKRRMSWKIHEDNLHQSRNAKIHHKAVQNSTEITLYPMQIRTFICKIGYYYNEAT